jgi:hypothetical protein
MSALTTDPADWERLLSEIVILAEETFADPERVERVKEAARQLEEAAHEQPAQK